MTTGLRARVRLGHPLSDYALAAAGALYFLAAFVLERLGLVEGRTSTRGPRWTVPWRAGRG